MMKQILWFSITCFFCFVEIVPAANSSEVSLERIVTQIDSMFPSMEGVVVSIEKQNVILDLKQGQPVKRGDHLKLIRFGADIIHPTSKKKIGRHEIDLGEAEVMEVRKNFSIAKLMDPTISVRPGDGVRSPFNELSFIIASPTIDTTQKIDKENLRLKLEKVIANHPRFKVPDFELDLWLLETDINAQNLLDQTSLDILNRLVKVDYLITSSVKSLKNKLVLNYSLYSAKTGHLQKQAKILSEKLPIRPLEKALPPRENDIQRSFARPEDGLVQYVGKQEFNFKIIDFDIGDINGDGRQELVVIAPNRMIVYAYKKNQYKQVATFRAENQNHIFLGVDVGDINKNGRDEIFITNQLDDRLISFALEASLGKKRLIKTWKNVNMYFRIIHPFGKRPTLLAQAPGFNDPFHGPIKRIAFKKGRYVNSSNLKLPSIYGMDFILYGLTLWDLNKDGKEEIIMLDEDYRLRVYSDKGRLLVESDEYYGHDPRLIDVGVKEDISGLTQEGKPVGLRGRLTFFRHGRYRYLLLPKNTSAGGKLLPGLAAIQTSGSIAMLNLSREGFKNSFETRKQKGYVAAYQVEKSSGKQPPKLHMVTVQEKALFGKPISTIYTYFWKNRD